MFEERVPFDELKEFFYDFIDTHIDRFFDMSSRQGIFEREYLDDHRDEILDNIITSSLPSPKEVPDEGDVEQIIKRAEAKKEGPKNYSKMDQYDLKKEVDAALDAKDFETLKKIQPYLKEGFLKYHVDEILNEEYVMKPLRNNK